MRRESLQKVKAVISSIYKRSGRDISAFQLAKAMYLTEYWGYKILERPILDIEFIYHYFGPYPKAIMDRLYKEGYFTFEQRVTFQGRRLSLHHPTTVLESPLNEEEERIVLLATLLVKRESRSGTEKLRKMVYSTEPMIAGVKGQPINMLHALERKRLSKLRERIIEKGESFELHPTAKQNEEDSKFLRASEILAIEDQASQV